MRKGAALTPKERLALDRLAKAGLDRRAMLAWRAVIAEARRLDGPEAERRKHDPGWRKMRGDRAAAARAWADVALALKHLSGADPQWAERVARNRECRAKLERLPALARKEAGWWANLGKQPEGGQPKLAPAQLAEIYRTAMVKSNGAAKLADLAALLELTTAQMKHAKAGKSLALLPLVAGQGRKAKALTRRRAKPRVNRGVPDSRKKPAVNIHAPQRTALTLDA